MSFSDSSAVSERRLRPLWDAIDSCQYKSAFRLACSLLIKQPDSVYLVVLKALVLERMGKAEEALALCEQAKASEPIDDRTLSTLLTVYRRLDRSEQATLCYEIACSKVPNNLELMLGLFNCYVRDYSFLKQQQVAMKMHKLFGEERFLLWAVCSIQLQVFCGNKDRALLALAEALLKKRLESRGFEELEAMLAYVALLEKEGKYDAALAVLSSKSGDLFSINIDKLKLEGKLLRLSHQYELAAKVFKEVLEMSPEDWATYLFYLDAILEVSSGGAGISEVTMNQSNGETFVSGLSSEESESRLQLAKVFVESLQGKDQHELRRGPFLASVEIERRRFLLRLREQNFSTIADSLQASVIDYFKRFGHLVSFAIDIQLYLRLIVQYCCDGFLERLHMACTEAAVESHVHLLRRKVSLLQVQMQFNCQATPDRDLVCQAMDVAKLYVESLKLSKDLDPQENMWGEELVNLAVTLLIQLFLRTRQLGYVVEAILLLELGLAIRKYSFQYKIMLVSLYSTIFCSSLAFDWYKTLDVKNILIETLSHHILLPLRRSMLWSELESVFSETVKFHEDYAKEAADFMIMAYRHCNYMKVLEFVQFKNRLQHSHNLLLAKVEGIVLQLVQKAGTLEDILLILEKLDFGNEPLKWGTHENFSGLSFNEALETRPWWSPEPGRCLLTEITEKEPSLHPEEAMEQVLEREERWRQRLCKRCLLPRLLHLSLNAFSFRNAGDEKAKSHTDELKRLVEKYAKCLGFAGEKMQELMDVSSLISLPKNFEVEVSDIFSLALFWTAHQLMSHSSLRGLANLIDMAKSFTTEFTSFAKFSETKSWDPSNSDIVASWSSFPSLVLLVTEAFTWYAICLQSWLRCLQPRRKSGKKKKKGSAIRGSVDESGDGDQSTLLGELQEYSDAFCNVLKGLWTCLTTFLEALEGSVSRVFLESLEEGFNTRIMAESPAVPVPGLVYSVLKSSLDTTDSLGERLDSVIRTYEVNPLLDRMAGSQTVALQRLSSVLKSIINSLQPVESDRFSHSDERGEPLVKQDGLQPECSSAETF